MKQSKNLYEGLGSGYINDEDLICMIRCFECGQENYGPVINSGTCAKCGHNPNEGIVKKKNPSISTRVLNISKTDSDN